MVSKQRGEATFYRRKDGPCTSEISDDLPDTNRVVGSRQPRWGGGRFACSGLGGLGLAKVPMTKAGTYPGLPEQLPEVPCRHDIKVVPLVRPLSIFAGVGAGDARGS